MRIKALIGVCLWMSFALILRAQHQELDEQPASWKAKSGQPVDSTCIRDAFRHGVAQGHFRYYFMGTDNAPGLKDYFANAAGGGLRFESAPFYGFQFAISGFYIFNLASSDLGAVDSTTGQKNRYEIGLFDLEDPYNHKDLDRLEELYLKYQYKGASVKLGRQLLNTPFVNLQDGRMRPTGAEGVYATVDASKKLKFEGGWLYAMSPRSTVRWYDVDESIGLYPMGTQPTGLPSQYKDNLQSKGIFMLSSTVKPAKGVKVQVADLFTENMFNAAFAQVDIAVPLKGETKLIGAAQGIRQDAVADGGNADPALTYIPRGSKAMTFGAKIGLKQPKWELSLNYNRITQHGRYLMPREWGRDPFFTFMPRERNEGLGDVHAVMAKFDRNFPKIRSKVGLSMGYYHLPAPNDFPMNKYGMPTYAQLNLDLRHTFHKMLQGLEAQVLIYGKYSDHDLLSNRRFEFNKVNMLGYNLILNYHF